MVIAMTLVCLVYVTATERSEITDLTIRSTADSHLSRSHTRQVSRMRARLRAMKAHPITTSGQECFATTESDARDKVMQSIQSAEPGLWDPMTDYSNALPSASSFMCTQGLTQDELDGISAALNTNTRVKPQLSITMNVDNAPAPEAAHAIIQSYLGRERYLEHVSLCLEQRKADSHTANVQLERIAARLIHLSTEQQEALKPLQDRLRAINTLVGIQALDDNGALVSLDNRPPADYAKELEEILSIAEAGFAILTPEQTRAYREIATGAAYSEVISQYKLTESFLPLPEKVREMIKSGEELRRLNEQEETQQNETPIPSN